MNSPYSQGPTGGGWVWMPSYWMGGGGGNSSPNGISSILGDSAFIKDNIKLDEKQQAALGEALVNQATDTSSKDAATAGMVFNGLNTAMGMATQITQLYYQSRMIDMQETHETNMYNLKKAEIDMAETIGLIQERILDGKNDLVRDLARIQSEVEMYKIDAEKEKSIQNTKTVASYGYLNSKFYNHGSPVASL